MRGFGFLLSVTLGLSFIDKAHAGLDCAVLAESWQSPAIPLNQSVINAPMWYVYENYPIRHHIDYTCDHHSNNNSVNYHVNSKARVYLDVASLGPVITHVTYQGKSFPVYQFYSAPGFGYLLGYSVGSGGVQQINSGQNGVLLAQHTPGFGPFYNGFFVKFELHMEMRLVKIGAIQSSSGAIGYGPMSHYMQSETWDKFSQGDGEWNEFYQKTTPKPFVNFKWNFQNVAPPPPATCTTPNVPSQVMDQVQTTQFGGVGSVVGGESFWMFFTGCSNHSQVRYRINPSGTSPNASQGLLPLIWPSTAQGLAVQVMHGTPDTGDNIFQIVQLGTWRTINTSASSFGVPMRVRYYRTGTIAAGSVHAAMTISFQYQ